ncbi:hypothetical protein FCJ57_17150 [Burkholderia diffusa]|nr:hypothetical protein [Burkholderia diffusa]NTY38040.1 hypothetical protein [Burkholderia diffusa]
MRSVCGRPEASHRVGGLDGDLGRREVGRQLQVDEALDEELAHVGLDDPQGTELMRMAAIDACYYLHF